MARKIIWRRVRCPVCGDRITNNALGRAAHIRHCGGVQTPPKKGTTSMKTTIVAVILALSGFAPAFAYCPPSDGIIPDNRCETREWLDRMARDQERRDMSRPIVCETYGRQTICRRD